MLNAENTNPRISSEVKRLDMTKENTLTGRFKTIRNFDLNLLTTFEAVYIHRSGTNAADVLGITPSAVSQALGRLRDYYHDPLFVREGKKLAPTTIATGIHEGLAEAYDNLIAKLQNVSFSSVPTRLIVNCSPYISMFTINAMSRILDEIAPECTIVHSTNNNSISDVEEALIFRKADIVFDAHPHLSHSRVSQQLFAETPVVICRKSHPRLSGSLTREQSNAERHIFLDSESANILVERLNIDILLRGERHCCFSSPSLLTIVSMVESTDMLAIVPRRFYEKLKNAFDVQSLAIDFNIAPLPVYMVYNKAALNNHFFAALVRKIADHFQQA